LRDYSEGWVNTAFWVGNRVVIRTIEKRIIVLVRCCRVVNRLEHVVLDAGWISDQADVGQQIGGENLMEICF
jgi:hypothetical protein